MKQNITESILKLVVELIKEKNGQEIVVIDVRDKVSYTDYLIIASGRSDKQVRAISDHIQYKLRERGISPLGVEGEKGATWILLDYGSLIIHIFQEEPRQYYDLESLWMDAPKIDFEKNIL